MQIEFLDLKPFAPRPRRKHKRRHYDGYTHAIATGGDLFAKYGVTDWNELCHFLAQSAHETGGFTILWESGAYSAKAIMSTFGVGRHSARVTWPQALKISAIPNIGDRRAKVLFERVYGSGNPRKARELGNVYKGDGYRFRGFSVMQTTGGRDHKRYFPTGDYSYRAGLEAALMEWQRKGCSKHAKAGDLRRITRLINGGYNGLQDREKYFERARRTIPKDALELIVPHEPQLDKNRPMKDRLAGSRKFALGKVMKRAGEIGAGVTATGAVVAKVTPPAEPATQSVQTVTDKLSVYNQLVDAVSSLATGASTLLTQFVMPHLPIVVVGVFVLLVVFGRNLIAYTDDDDKEGRYTPSGKAEA